MNDLFEMIISQLGNDTVDRMSAQVNEDPSNTQRAIQNAIPILVNALARNTSNSDGANSFLGALDRDHDGSILDNMGGFLSNPAVANGAGILKHVLGGNRSKVENYLSKSSGISLGSAGNILEMLAPILMGFLGRQNRSTSSGGGIIDILQSVLKKGQAPDQQQEARQESIFNKLLDKDDDGSIADDILDIGSSIFGKFLRNQ
ncbi:MAG TPA: DUF937 domain-containing protein [Bacteroidales bacterium]|nr:DUF937 domain-containing protein [Bacteroidales bacterium]HRZ20427.1 DUF937 domain-containing protein [Bacteroidales bacterium]